jgi:glyceraldehyde-3-phosphate dehydrogenase (NADP+)
MKTRYPLQIAGGEVESGDWLPVVDPWDGSLVAEVALAGEPEMGRAVAAAVEAFPAFRKAGNHFRIDLLHKMAAGLRRRRDELAALIVAEAGKPIALAKGEVDRAINTFSLAAEEAGRIGGEVIPLDIRPDAEGRIGLTSRFPRGVVAAVTPFNFPLNLVAHKVAPALAGGNTLVLKPAPQAPLSALLLGEIAGEAGLPAGVLNVVPASAEVSAALVVDRRVRMVSFTGSADVGWGIAARAGKKKVLLELGGNASVIVEPDADLEFAAKRIAFGSFAYSGQICISVQHILVHDDIFGRFRELLLAAVAELAVGDPRDPETAVGPMISGGAAERVMEWIGEAREGGAELLCGGRRRGGIVEPTLLQGTEAAMKVGCRELFGPVATLDSYSSFEDALARVNATVYGLQAGIFTASLRRAFEAYRRIEVGGVIINDFPTFRVDHMPYGGVKESGLGREGVRYAIEEMTESRLLVLNLSSST